MNPILQTKNSVKGIVLPLAVFLLLAVLLSGCSSPAVQAGPPQAAQMPDYPAELVVEEFYGWYMSYPGNPLVDKAYQTSPYLSPDFIKKMDDLLSKGGLMADPIVCAQDVADGFEAAQPEFSGSTATVRVTSTFGNSMDVTLEPGGENWLITRITCVVQ